MKTFYMLDKIMFNDNLVKFQHSIKMNFDIFNMDSYVKKRFKDVFGPHEFFCSYLEFNFHVSTVLW